MRYASVPHLNAAPLTAGLPDVVFEPPSRLGALLVEDRVDAALLPVFERFRIPDLVHVPGIMIGCDGPAESVLLHLAKPLAQVRRVRLDPNSRSSNALLRVLLAKKHGLSVEIVDGDADAWLTIADASFAGGGVPTLDLGAEWKDWTGLPFAFAVWTHKRGHPAAAEIERTLDAAKAEGRRSIDAIARRAGIGFDRAKRYLTVSMRYDLGERELRGIDRFVALCREMKLL